MYPEQFAALAALMPMRDGAAQACVRLVMVDGMAQADAARQTGLSRQAAHQAVNRAQQKLSLARQAAGCS